jgi:hypothetical protein
MSEPDETNHAAQPARGSGLALLPVRWSAQRKVEIVLRRLSGEALVTLCHQTAVPVPRLENGRRWIGPDPLGAGKSTKMIKRPLEGVMARALHPPRPTHSSGPPPCLLRVRAQGPRLPFHQESSHQASLHRRAPRSICYPLQVPRSPITDLFSLANCRRSLEPRSLPWARGKVRLTLA